MFEFRGQSSKEKVNQAYRPIGKEFSVITRSRCKVACYQVIAMPISTDSSMCIGVIFRMIGQASPKFSMKSKDKSTVVNERRAILVIT